MNKWNKFLTEGELKTVGIVACLNDEQQFLVIRRSNIDDREGQWTMPGGHIDEKDCTIEHGAVRELEEEAGLSASTGDLTYIDKTMRGRMLRYFFATREWTGNVKLVPNPKTDILEHIEYKWATIEDIEGLADPSFPDYILRKALVKMRNSNE